MNRMIRSQTPLMRFMYQFYDAVQSWLVLLVVGFFIGLVAACLDIASDWSNDVKFGICQRGFWIPRHMCCRDSPTISECTQWTTWGQFFSSTKGAIECVLFLTVLTICDILCRTLNYFFYVAFAVGMASLAAYLVLVFAPTAAGSGIAEVKVILGGFGIRNFLSGWTLLIKVPPPLSPCERL
jgi:chloride channel 3/4/5